MHNTTKAIVLSKIKYKDSDLIIRCYTSKDGLVSYLLRGVLKSSKGHKKVAYFHPLSLLEIEQSYKTNQSLRTIKEVKPQVIYSSLHTDVVKGSIVMFLSEILNSVLKEEEANLEMFDYLENSFLLLDAEDNYSNFHLLFLLNLTKYLGCYPDTQNMDKDYFNIVNGQFESQESPFYSISGNNLVLLKRLLGTNFEALHTVLLNSSQRQSFLQMLFLYFELHLGHFKKPKSLQIFNQIFN